MIIGRPRATRLSDIAIDADKDMNGKALSNLGDLTLAANKRLITPNLSIKEGSATRFYLRNADDSAYVDAKILALRVTSGMYFEVDGQMFRSPAANGTVTNIKSYETGLGMKTTARLVGAVDPYVELTVPPVIMPAAKPSVFVNGHVGVDSTTNLLWARLSGGTEHIYGSSSPNVFKARRYVVNYNSASPLALVTIPANSIVFWIGAETLTAWDGTTPLVNIGIAADPDDLVALSGTELTTTGIKTSTYSGLGDALYAGGVYNPFSVGATSYAAIATITPDSSSQGQTAIWIVWIELGAEA